MSFFSKNENFFRIKFHIEMRGMSLEQKIIHYNNTSLKNDTLKRLKDYFKSSEVELETKNFNSDDFNLFTSSQNQLQNKTKNYLEVIELLNEYEYETILYSIYFEDSSLQLLSILS